MVAEVASIEVTLKLLGISQYQAALQGGASVTEQTGQRITRTMDNIASSGNRVARASEGFSRSDGALRNLGLGALRAETSILALTRALQAAGVAVGGLAGGAAVNAFRNYADQAITIQNRLATIIPVQQQRAKVEEEIYQSAQRSRTSYEATANLFSRLSLSASNLGGANPEQILKVVETTQKALITGGATTQEAAAVATQLTQALGSGRLAGDELRSISENSPVLIQAIAKEFGVSVGALKDMGSEGQLAADRVFKAILNSTADVEEMFSRTTPTISAGIQQIDNALVRYIGSVDKSLGASKSLIGGLQFVANNLGSIGDAAGLAVAAIGGSMLGRGVNRTATAVRTPFVQARAAAQSRVDDAKEAAAAAQAAFERSQGTFLDKRLQYDIARGNPTESNAAADKLRDLAKAEKTLEANRKALEVETEKLTRAEAVRDAVAAESVEARRNVARAEESAARSYGNRQAEVAGRAMDYQVAAGNVLSAQGTLPKAQAEKLAAAQAQREADVARVAAIDAANAAARQEMEGISAPTAGPIVQKRAARQAELQSEISQMVEDRNRLGLDLRNVEVTAMAREEDLAQANLSAKRRHLAEYGKVGVDLVAAEKAVVAQRAVVAERAAAITGYSAARKAQSADTVMKQIEAEISAQERLGQLEAKRDALATRHTDLLEQGPQVSGSLKPDQVRDLNAARTQREAMFAELAQMDSQIEARRSELDRISISPRSQRALASDAANQARTAELNAGVAAAAAERETLTGRIQKADETIDGLENELAARTAAARQRMIDSAEAAADALRVSQQKLAADLETLQARRKATIESEILSEEDRARRLAAIDRQIAERRAQVDKMQGAATQMQGGVSRAREAVQLSGQGKVEDARLAAAEAEQAIVSARKSADEAVQSVAKAERAASAMAIVQSVAKSSLGALTGLVNFLGGPVGAAFAAVSVAIAGYAIYQARAAEQAEKHAKALEGLIVRTQELNALNAQGEAGVRSQAERQRDLAAERDAIRGVGDIRTKVLENYRGAYSQGQVRGPGLEDLGGSILPNDLDAAAQRLGLDLGTVVQNVKNLQLGSVESSRATQQLADILTEAAKADPKFIDKATAAQDLAKAEAAAAAKVRDRAEAERIARGFEARARSPKYAYDADEGGPLTKAPFFSADDVKRETEAAKGYIESLGDSITDLGGKGTKFPEFQEMRTALQGAVRDIADVRLQAQQLVSGQYVPTDLANLVQQFAQGKISVEEYAIALQDAKEKMPNFSPLINSLIAGTEKGLTASAVLADIGAKIDALDGREANISINIKTTQSIADVRKADDKAIADQEAEGAKALTDLQSKTRGLQLRAAGQEPRAKALELQQSNPGLDLKAATAEYEKQKVLEDQISASKKKGHKSKDEKDAETLEKKLRELDQDARVAGLDDFDKKTVRFAQDAKVASDQIEEFVKAAQSGDMSKLPPVMQQIYEKMMLLEGVKLARSALDDIFPARKLARELDELKAASDATPEIAANIELITMKVRSDNASDFTKGFTSGFTDMVKSVADGTATMSDALETFKKKIMDLALDAAFKPLQTMLQSLLGQFGQMGLQGLNLSGTGGSGGVDVGFKGFFSGGPGYAEGVTGLGVIEGAGTGTSDSILAKGPSGMIRVSRGETIVSAKRTQKYLPVIRAMQTDRLPAFADGVVSLGAESLVTPAAQMEHASAGQKLDAEQGTARGVELHIHGGADQPRAETSMGSKGPRLDLWLDHQVAMALMAGSATGKAMKQYGVRQTGAR